MDPYHFNGAENALVKIQFRPTKPPAKTVIAVAELVVTVAIRVCSGRYMGHRDPRPASKLFTRSAAVVLPL